MPLGQISYLLREFDPRFLTQDFWAKVESRNPDNEDTMARKKITLNAQKHGNKWRYRKTYKGHAFKSGVYDHDNRENHADAVRQFREWQRQHETIDDRKAAVRSAAISVAGHNLAEMIKADNREKQNARDLNTVGILNGWLSLEQSEQALATYARKRFGGKGFFKPMIDSYVAGQQLRVKRDKSLKRSFDQSSVNRLKCHLAFALSVFGNLHIDDINEDEVNAIYNAIDAKAIAEITKRDYLGTFRKFIKRAVTDKAKARLPTNLDADYLQFERSVATPHAPSVQETLDVIAKLQERKQPLMELCVLLHLNCGCYSGDIADLEHTDIDFDAMTLTYKRSKIERFKKDPVTYPLWSRTLELIKALDSDHATLCFVNEKGKHLGKGKDNKRTDNIGKRFRRHKITHFPTFGFGLMDFRKTAATELMEIAYNDLGDQFLQHGSDSTTLKFYAAHFRQRFTEGVLALEKVFYPEV